jgi:hypothetical protein
MALPVRLAVTWPCAFSCKARDGAASAARLRLGAGAAWPLPQRSLIALVSRPCRLCERGTVLRLGPKLIFTRKKFVTLCIFIQQEVVVSSNPFVTYK